MLAFGGGVSAYMEWGNRIVLKPKSYVAKFHRIMSVLGMLTSPNHKNK